MSICDDGPTLNQQYLTRIGYYISFVLLHTTLVYGDYTINQKYTSISILFVFFQITSAIYLFYLTAAISKNQIASGLLF